MTVSSNCHVGELVTAGSSKIKRMLKHNRFGRGSWFVITTAPEENEVLYVLSNRELRNGLYDLNQLRVLAISGSKREALGLVTVLIQEACDADRLFDLKKYFMEY